MALSCLLLWKYHGVLFVLLSWYVSQPANQIGACCDFLCHVMWRCVSLLSQMPNSSSVVLCALKLRPLEQWELRSMLLTQIDFVTSLFPPPPLPRGHGALCRQGHWANGSESDKKHSENLPPYLHLKTHAWVKSRSLRLFFSSLCRFLLPFPLVFSSASQTLGCNNTRSLWLVLKRDNCLFLFIYCCNYFLLLSFYYLLFYNYLYYFD